MHTSPVSPLDLNLRHVRGFLAVCAQGSISLAAKATGLSQPALTQAIVKLELQLGLALFERHRLGVRPTAAARTFMPRAEAALRHLSQGARTVAGKPLALDRRVAAHQLRAFLSLVETHSFTATAAALQLSVSSAQRAVRSIETTLGQSLLERRGRQTMVNSAGRRFARSCHLAMHELQAAFLDLGMASDKPHMALGTTPLARALLAPEAMSRTRAQFAHTGFQVREGSWGELAEMLRDGQLDIIVGELPDPWAEDLQKLVLYSEPVIVVAGRQHPLAKHKRPSASALASYPWIIGPRTSPLRAEWEGLFEAGRPPAPIECESIMVIGRLLTSDHLLSLATPDQVALQIRSGLLVQIGPPLRRRHTIGLTWRKGWALTAMQQHFLSKLQEVAGEMDAHFSRAALIGQDWV